ncbi:hypothetical protein chiPu_0009214 [Chiloscyllium punctatum]|uniref:Uncharacterized protein n=1 Tax=Chiloscyllium punctatum TaxID=137246 RepID=A0A401SK46_CHIPU|nr:hypothetical protein [Chiloscyllium punctatum]
MPHFLKTILILFCLTIAAESRKHRKRRWASQVEPRKQGSPILRRIPDTTKTRTTNSEHLLRVGDHDFTMRPAFGESFPNAWIDTILHCQAPQYLLELM